MKMCSSSSAITNTTKGVAQNGMLSQEAKVTFKNTMASIASNMCMLKSPKYL